MNTQLTFLNFSKYFIFHPNSKELTEKSKLIAKIATIVLGILTLGIFHLLDYFIIYNKNFTLVAKDNTSSSNLAINKNIQLDNISINKNIQNESLKGSPKNSPNELLLDFYEGTGKDIAERTLDEIWTWDHDLLESSHNYIQWLFPLNEPSQFNHEAPVLNDELSLKLKSSPQVIKNLKKSFVLMMSFYGFGYDSDPKMKICTYAPDFIERQKIWYTEGNHNFLRITRILKCLNKFGLTEEAKAFFDILTNLHMKNPEIGKSAYGYWKQAMPE